MRGPLASTTIAVLLCVFTTHDAKRLEAIDGDEGDLVSFSPDNGLGADDEGRGPGDVNFSTAVSMYDQTPDVDKVPYDWNRPTSDNYGSVNGARVPFVGRYAEIRKERDYTYHVYYQQFRQVTQDAIIEHFMGNVIGKPPAQPWIIYTAGAMGAGKGHTINLLLDKHVLSLDNFVHVNMDDIRAMLPENDEYIRRDILSAGYNTQREAGYIAEILQAAARRDGRHIFIDGSLQDHVWFTQVFQRIQAEDKAHNRPRRLFAILHVVTPLPDVRTNVAARGPITGRMVPDVEIVQSFEAVPKSVAVLKDQVDACYALENIRGATMPGLLSCDSPPQRLAQVSAAPDSVAWKSFTWILRLNRDDA